MRSKKAWLLFFVFILVAAAGIWLGFLAFTRNNFMPIPEENIEDVDLNVVNRHETLEYNADKEVELALDLYSGELDGAKIIRDDSEKEQPRIALVFQGLADETTNKQVVDLLKKYSRRATFYVSGMEAAEDSDSIAAIIKGKNELGNNALNADTYMEQYDGETIVENLVRSGKILDMISDEITDTALLNATYYTKDVCKACEASGFIKVVAPSAGHFLSYNSFKDYEQAKQYIEKQKGDTILVFKMDGPLELVEYEPKDDKITIADDKQATIDNHDIPSDEEEKNNSIIQTLTWILEAMKEDKISSTSISKFEAADNETYIAGLLEDGKSVKAQEYESLLIQDMQVGLLFEGLCDEETYLNLKSLLEKYEADATFFVTGEEAKANRNVVSKIAASGYSLGNSGLNDESLGEKNASDCYENINRAYREILMESEGRAKIFMPRDRKVTDELKRACGVMSLDIVNPKGNPTPKEGEFYRFDLSNKNFDVSSVEKALKEAKGKGFAVVDARTLINNSKKTPEIPRETLDQLREENAGKKAKQINTLQTTNHGMAFLFYGVSNKPVTKDVIKKLADRGYNGTFFVTYDEMKNCSEQIEMLIDAGEEIGIAYTITKDFPDDFESVAKYILICQNYLQWRYNLETSLVKMPYGETNDEILEAVSATGCELIGHEFTMIRSVYQDAENADFFYDASYKKIKPHRGSILYFNINYITKDKELEPDYEGDTIAGDLLNRIFTNKIDPIAYKDVSGNVIGGSRYRVKSYGELFSGPGRYSLRSGQNLININKDVLTSMEKDSSKTAYMFKRYIGSPSTDGVAVLPGFSNDEIAEIDKCGRFTSDKVLFLTFDDWGTDESINHLLAVLDKYDVKATFFIKTQYVSDNPNLLRAIAVDGHQIGSHTDTHFVLSNYVTTPAPTSENPEAMVSKYESLSVEQGLALRTDIVKSFNTLYRYIGDVSNNGVPSFSTMFRPPTLAISKVGMYQVFDVGCSYCVSGDFSTHDYEATSLDELVNTLQNGVTSWDGVHQIQNGSVIVMHMTESAKYTAQALDIMIPIWQSQGYSFARLDGYLL